jgi:uncharacterized protein (DUF1697 family)
VPDHAAFLRGVNVGKHHRVSGAELRELFEGVGLTEVATFRTSGNVVFSGTAGAARIEAALAAALGYEPKVFLRTAAELRAIAAFEPFPAAAVEASKGKLQVAMLDAKPAAAARSEVLAMASDEDALAFGDRELYWLPSGGTLETALDLNAIETLIGPTTRRTMGTVEQLAAKFFPSDPGE